MEQNPTYLHYNKFAIGSAEDQYPLNISGFDSIGLTDPFVTHPINEMKFSSRDRDNDLWGNNCGLADGGWWHRSCSYMYIQINEAYTTMFMYLNREAHSPTSVEIKIRPQNCNID